MLNIFFGLIYNLLIFNRLRIYYKNKYLFDWGKLFFMPKKKALSRFWKRLFLIIRCGKLLFRKIRGAASRIRWSSRDSGNVDVRNAISLPEPADPPDTHPGSRPRRAW